MSSPYRTTSDLIVFRTMQATPAPNGGLYGAVVTAVNALPTVTRNGTSAQIGAPVWTRATLDLPGVACLPEFGTVVGVNIIDGGEGFTGDPTPSASGVTFGAVTRATGLTSYNISAVASNYAQPPAVVIADSGGGTAPPAI